MPRILVLQHVAAEPLGTLDPLIRARGHRIRYVNFEREPEAQPNLDRYRGLIVLGGPMNVEDHPQRAHLRTEMRLIEQALAQDKPVLGICLGAQLLAHVLGAPVTRHSTSEIGWHSLEATDAGREDQVLAPLGASTPVFQWHSYTFAIPRSAQHLARTSGCENQAFRYGGNAYGFQFHLEVDEALIGRWLATPGYRNELLAASGGQDPDTVFQATQVHAARMKELAEPVFNNFLDLIGRPQRKIVLPSHL
ncbi:MAG: gamma-glutamyl-gamma-aminobutyrate hydrolase family protein [Lysobacteraceae bacterium]